MFIDDTKLIKDTEIAIKLGSATLTLLTGLLKSLQYILCISPISYLPIAADGAIGKFTEKSK